jgi:hypothetical protein
MEYYAHESYTRASAVRASSAIESGTRVFLKCAHRGAGVGAPVSIQCGQFMIAMTGMGVYIGAMRYDSASWKP